MWRTPLGTPRLHPTAHVVQHPDDERPEPYRPGPLVLLHKAHRLAYERLAQVHHASLPFGPLLRTLRTVASAPYSGELEGWGRNDGVRLRHLPECLVRPLMVVAGLKRSKARRSPAVGLRRRGRLGLERPVQPLKATVLLRGSGG